MRHPRHLGSGSPVLNTPHVNQQILQLLTGARLRGASRGGGGTPPTRMSGEALAREPWEPPKNPNYLREARSVWFPRFPPGAPLVCLPGPPGTVDVIYPSRGWRAGESGAGRDPPEGSPARSARAERQPGGPGAPEVTP